MTRQSLDSRNEEGKNLKEQHEKVLTSICDAIHRFVLLRRDERKKEAFGDNPPWEFIVAKMEKVEIEIRKENTRHHLPLIHVTHSNEIDASTSLKDFSILVGKIDTKTARRVVEMLQPKQQQLLEIWNELNEKDNSVNVHKLISSLNLLK